MRANAPCSSANIIPAGPTDSIPPNAIILLFTSDDVRSTYNMSCLCAKGFPIYVLQNDCRRTIGAFSNVSNTTQNCATDSNRYRHYVVRNLKTGCYDSLVYDRCHSTSGYADGTFAINLPGIDTLSVANGGIKNNAGNSCSGIDFTTDGLDYSQIVKSSDTTFKFVIPPSFCNTGFHYIKAIINPGTPQVTSNTIQYKLVCLDVATNISRQEICSGQTAPFSISSTDPNATFSWTVSGGAGITGASAGNGNSINQTLTYNGATRDSLTYTITANDAGCTKTTSVKVVVKNNSVSIPNIGNDTTYCGSFSRNLSTGNASTVWNNNIGIPSVTTSQITVSQPGKYWATISGSCGSVSDTINIAQSAGLTFSFGGNTSVCQGGTTTLDAGSGFDTYIWNTTANSQAIIISTPGKYWVDVTKNGCKGNDTISVTQIAKPSPFSLGNDTAICGAVSKNLSSGNPSTTWTLDGNVITTSANITATQFGQYIAKATNSCGSVSDTLNITQINTPTPINIGNDTSYCGTFTRNLSTGNAATIWNNNIGIPSTTAAQITVTQAGKYWATINGTCGAVTDTINITQSPGLPFSFGGNTSVCIGGTLDAGSGYSSYIWNTGAATQSIAVLLSGKYWVDVFKNGCKGSDSIIVTLLTKPTAFSLGKDTTYCDAFSRQLNTNSNNTVWNNNVSVPSTTGAQITATKAGKYWATITNSCGSVADTIELFQNFSPAGFNLGNDTSVCGTFTKTVSTGNNATVWNNNISLPTVTAPQYTISQIGKYWATITNNCGSFTDTIEIKNGSNLLVNIGDTITKCTGTSVVLNAGAGFTSYVWNTSALTQTISVINTGKYFVDVTKNNCKGSDTVEVVDIQKPTINSLGNDTTYCGNFSQILVTGNSTTKWSTNVTASQITVNTSGKYIATITNACGTVADTINIIQKPLPIVSIGNDREFCDSIELTVGNGIFSSILWNTNDSVNSILVKDGGIYSVQVVDTNNCKNSDSANIKKVCDYTVYMPTAFSPNNDGINDILFPLTKIKGIIIERFVIFNRWNQRIFESYNFAPNDKNFGWNGELKNTEQEVDSYTYFIRAILPDNTTKEYKGVITLLK
ncbi:MAG: gliding motility-associated C-terminal domain-containing protein [Saprospirales bacterium]|nr:gliding motility-associated C-terminal domain-containing protein [Saprospirales bacterium]